MRRSVREAERGCAPVVNTLRTTKRATACCPMAASVVSTKHTEVRPQMLHGQRDHFLDIAGAAAFAIAVARVETRTIIIPTFKQAAIPSGAVVVRWVYGF